jgi:hypothetical protein
MDKRSNMPVRIDEETLKWARIAASYKGLSVAEYVSRALLEVARRDIHEEHAKLAGGKPVKGRRGAADPAS